MLAEPKSYTFIRRISVVYVPSDKLSKYETVKVKEDEESALPDVDWDTCDDIAIIGAGIAGSYAGYRLRDLDKKITVYEYSDRIGGRCYTGKFTGVPDVNVEFGAKRFYPGSKCRMFWYFFLNDLALFYLLKAVIGNNTIEFSYLP